MRPSSTDARRPEDVSVAAIRYPGASTEPTSGAGERGGATIQLWRERDGEWRWAYREGDVEITSNHPYPTEAAARTAAAVAYPGAPVSSEEVAAPSPQGQKPTRWTLLLMITAVWRWYRQARRPRAAN
ncbi:MAG TPA: hypothetical protein VE712_00500 [Actinomycetota bacterium]|nr:hypothetical protein [Actinomycetota bacterium]